MKSSKPKIMLARPSVWDSVQYSVSNSVHASIPYSVSDSVWDSVKEDIS